MAFFVCAAAPFESNGIEWEQLHFAPFFQLHFYLSKYNKLPFLWMKNIKTESKKKKCSILLQNAYFLHQMWFINGDVAQQSHQITQEI